MAPELNSNQTFPIILPNIIHQNKGNIFFFGLADLPPF